MANTNDLLIKKNDLLQHRADALEQAEKCYGSGDKDGYTSAMDKVKGFNAQLEPIQALISEHEKQFGGSAEDKPGVGVERCEKAGVQLLTTIRSTEKYADAWMESLRKGYTVESGRFQDGLDPLYEAEKAMSISGGDPVGSEGGFLVPVEFDNRVAELSKDYLDLSKLVRVEHVRRNSGWRAVETAGTRTPLQKVAELAEIPKNSKPKFSKIAYDCEEYGDRLPISSELFSDAAGLIQYLAGWWAPKYILTKNDLILDLLGKLDFAALAGETGAAQMQALKTLMNTQLNTAHKRNATLLTNCFGYDAMDNMVDLQNRPILTPDPKDPDFTRFKARPVAYADADIIPDVAHTSTNYHPLYVGDFKAFAVLFERDGLRLASTDVGGDAWATNSREMRALCRMCARTIDANAVKYTGFSAGPVAAKMSVPAEDPAQDQA